MWERFTNRAKQVKRLAEKEAQRLNHNYVGTEHILLGMIKLGQGVAVDVLRKMNLDFDTIQMEIEKIVGHGGSEKLTGKPTYTPRARHPSCHRGAAGRRGCRRPAARSRLDGGD